MVDEFYALGDRERSLGLRISALCDRHTDTDVPASQLGFLRFVCRPFYAATARLLPGRAADLARLDDNICEWEARAKAAKEHGE